MLPLSTEGLNECFKNLPAILWSIQKNGGIRKIRYKSRHILDEKNGWLLAEYSTNFKEGDSNGFSNKGWHRSPSYPNTCLCPVYDNRHAAGIGP